MAGGRFADSNKYPEREDGIDIFSFYKSISFSEGSFMFWYFCIFILVKKVREGNSTKRIDRSNNADNLTWDLSFTKVTAYNIY